MQNLEYNHPLINSILLLLFPIFLSAQTSFDSYHKEFDWQKTNASKTILIDVKNGTKLLEMDFEGNITEGDLHVTVYDPEGNRVTGFSLVTSDSDGEDIHIESSDGNSNISITNTNSNSNSNSNSDSGSKVSVVSSASSSGYRNVSVESKSKNKGKNKGKGKNKNKNKNKDSTEYTVSANDSESKTAKGIMHKQILTPMSGKWKFVIEIKNVSGTMSADIEQD